MNKLNELRHKRLYNKIVKIIIDQKNYDNEYNRYILDLKDGFLFYYLLTGKIVRETPLNGFAYHREVIFKDSETPYQLIDKIKALLNEIKL